MAVWARNGLNDDPSMVVRARIFNANGTASTDEFAIGTWAVDGTDGYDIPNMTLTELADGNVVVSYVRNFGNPGGDEPVFSVIDPSIAPGSPGFVVIQDAEYQQTDVTTLESPPQVVALADGRFASVWIRDGLSDDLTSMVARGRIFNADGTPATGEFQIGTLAVDGDDNYDTSNFSITELSDGRLAFGFVKNLSSGGGTQDPYVTIIDPSVAPGSVGFIVASDIRVNNNLTSAHPYIGPPVILPMPGVDGNFIAAWVNEYAGDGHLMARMFNSSGQPISIEVQITNAENLRVSGNDGFDWDNIALTAVSATKFAVGWVGISDGAGTGVYSTMAQFTGSVANNAPVDGGESITATEDVPLTVANGAAGDLLDNASDADSDPLTISAYSIAGQAGPFAVGMPYNIAGIGTVTIGANGSYSFAPVANYNGTVPAITYTVSDGNGGTDTSTLQLSISAVNDLPNDGDETIGAIEDVAISVADGDAGDLFANATDADGDAPTITTFSVAGEPGPFIVGTPYPIAGIGVLTINANGSYSFVPAANYNGTVPTITYDVTDGNGGTDTSTLQLSIAAVNDPASISLNGGASIHSVADTDYAATYTENATPVAVTAPTAFVKDFGEDDVYTLALSLAGFSNGSAEKITIGGAEFSIGTGSTQIVMIGGTSFAVAYTTAHNIITIEKTGYLPIPVADLNALMQGITYHNTSDAPTAGVRQIGFFANESLNSTTDFSYSRITVVPVNDAPVANADTRTTAEGGPLNVGAASGLLANDTDVDSGPISIAGFTIAGDPSTYLPGQLAILDGIGTLLIAANGSYNFSPSPDFNRVIPAVTYTLSDASGGTAISTFSIIVTAVNDAPAAVNDGPIAVTEDTPVNGNVLANDTDVESDPLSVTEFSIPGIGLFAAGSTATIPGVGSVVIATNGDYTFVPTANYNGPVPTITYTSSDGTDTDTGTLALASVAAVNDAPSAAADHLTTSEDAPLSGNLLVNNGAGADVDVDGDMLSVTRVAGGNSVAVLAGLVDGTGIGLPVAGSNGGTFTIAANGTIAFTPGSSFQDLDTGESRTTSFVYQIDDGHGAISAAVATVTVTGITEPVVIGAVTQNANGTLAVTGTGEPGASVSIAYPDGSTTSTTVAADGTFAVMSAVPQTSGSVTVTQTDSQAHVDNDVSAYTDATAPLAPSITAIGQNPNGTVTVTGTGEPGSTVTVTFPDGSTAAADVAADGSYTATSATPQTSGAIAAAQTDDAGNTSPSVHGTVVAQYETLPVQMEHRIGAPSDIGSRRGDLNGNLISDNGAASILLDESLRLTQSWDDDSRRWSGWQSALMSWPRQNSGGAIQFGFADGQALNAETGRIRIEAMIRGGVLTIILQEHAPFSDTHVRDYQISMVDGSALPAWLERPSADMLHGRVPGDAGPLSIRLEVTLSNGSKQVQTFQLDPANGVLTSLPGNRADTAPVFSDQLRMFASIDATAANDLAAVLLAVERVQ